MRLPSLHGFKSVGWATTPAPLEPVSANRLRLKTQVPTDPVSGASKCRIHASLRIKSENTLLS
jgi:hypothetical protein